ncbi:MAG: hypothetical protein ACOCZ6_05895, partial [Nanoarchaeota archaeon]
MENLIALNNKRVKSILSRLNEQFGYNGDSLKKYAFFLKKKDSSIKIITRDVTALTKHKVNIDSMGLKIGKEVSDGILLTIEGTQLIGPYCTKNIIEISEQEGREWLKGSDIPTNNNNCFAIIKQGHDFLGSGKVKNNKVLNNIPKTRRLKCSD